MSDRYVGTFDSSTPMRGVVVDEEGGRYCTFPSLEKAQDAAARWNQPPLIEFDPPMAWRSIDTGELLDRTIRCPECGDLLDMPIGVGPVAERYPDGTHSHNPHAAWVADGTNQTGEEGTR